MLTIDDYMFGNRALHEQLRNATQVLVTMAEHAPSRVGIGELCEATGHSAREVTKQCRSLENAGLLRATSSRNREWQLSCDANVLTLETVYLCVIEEAARRSSSKAAEAVAPDKSLHRVDLLLTQAAMTVHQSVLTHLRQFSIGTLRRREPRESALRSRWDRAETRVAC